MSQIPPGPPGRAFTNFLIGFAMVEGALLSAIVLATVFEVITDDLMIPLIIAVAVVGGAVMTWRVLTLNKLNQRESDHPSRSPHSGQAGADSSGLSGLGEQDPMAKYRDPNR